jgi:hypothetical protein
MKFGVHDRPIPPVDEFGEITPVDVLRTNQCDSKRSCLSPISSVYLFLFKSESGGLVDVTHKYRALKLVFVLFHIDSSKTPFNVDCHTVVYGEKPRTDRTCRLNIRLPSKIVSLLKTCLYSYMYLLSYG